MIKQKIILKYIVISLVVLISVLGMGIVISKLKDRDEEDPFREDLKEVVWGYDYQNEEGEFTCRTINAVLDILKLAVPGVDYKSYRSHIAYRV